MDDMDKIYDTYKINKNKLKIDDWVVVDEYFYYKYKDNITINSLTLYHGENELTKRKERYVVAESKKEYILLKYNSNFLAVNICEREYDLTKNITLVMINKNSVHNIENNTGEVPDIKYICKILGWKITRKAIKNLEEIEDI
jgi:hypothetical protein